MQWFFVSVFFSFRCVPWTRIGVIINVSFRTIKQRRGAPLEIRGILGRALTNAEIYRSRRGKGKELRIDSRVPETPRALLPSSPPSLVLPPRPLFLSHSGNDIVVYSSYYVPPISIVVLIKNVSKKVEKNG